MTLSKRERNIALGLGITVGLVVLWEVVLQPYLDSLDAIKKQYQTALITKSDDLSLIHRQRELTKVWNDIKDGGLSDDESKAESQALNAALDWAQAAGVNITAVKPERSTEANSFQIIGFHVTGNGSTPAIARMLRSFETATIPVRVSDMQITPRKEGTDDLTVQLSVSTLCMKPEIDKTTITRAGGEEQSWN